MKQLDKNTLQGLKQIVSIFRANQKSLDDIFHGVVRIVKPFAKRPEEVEDCMMGVLYNKQDLGEMLKTLGIKIK